jgi:hypothetical protein
MRLFAVQNQAFSLGPFTLVARVFRVSARMAPHANELGRFGNRSGVIGSPLEARQQYNYAMTSFCTKMP